jgi:hypothetical protein
MKQEIIIDKENKVKIIKNFLIEPYFIELKSILMGPYIPWFFQSDSLEGLNDKTFMFTHSVYYKQRKDEPSLNPGWVGDPNINKLISPMVWFIKEHLNFKELSRIKINLTTNRNENVEHMPHVDYMGENEDKLKVAIFHVNTCNGYTKINNLKIKNEENQLILFNNIKHCYSTATDVSSRVVINFNFFT